MVRQPIGLTTHRSEKVSLVRKPMVRKSVSLVRKTIGPKKCNLSENSVFFFKLLNFLLRAVDNLC